MTGTADADYCAREVRRHDPDRYLAALFAPASRRESLLALYAFNLEIARIREIISEPMMGRIRLQWWRDALAGIYAGTPRRHQVVAPLARAIRRHDLTRDLFDAMLDAREQDLQDGPPETLADLMGYTEATSGGLCELAVESLGVRHEISRRAANLVGTAWALVGLIRAMPFHLRQGRIYLPVELEQRHGVDRRSMLALRSSDALRGAVGEVAGHATTCLRDARALRAENSASALSALLPAAMAESYLKQLAARNHDPFDPRLATRPPGRILRAAAAVIRGRY